MIVLQQVLRRRLVVGLLIGLVVAVPLWWFAWMSPAGSKLAAAHVQQQQALATRATLLERLAELREDRTEAKAATTYLNRFGAAVPKTADAPGLVVEVFDLAQRTGVKLSSVTDDSEAAAAGYSTIPVSIEVSGGHNDLLSFVDGLYRIPRLLTVQGLNLSGATDLNHSSQSSMTASISATAYTLATLPSARAAS